MDRQLDKWGEKKAMTGNGFPKFQEQH